jgi:hypothetical protein
MFIMFQGTLEAEAFLAEAEVLVAVVLLAVGKSLLKFRY